MNRMQSWESCHSEGTVNDVEPSYNAGIAKASEGKLMWEPFYEMGQFSEDFFLIL